MMRLSEARRECDAPIIASMRSFEADMTTLRFIIAEARRAADALHADMRRIGLDMVSIGCMGKLRLYRQE